MRLIDADALERMGYMLVRTYQKDKETMVYETKKLSDVPSAQPQRKVARWEILYPNHTYKYHCSECGANHKYMFDFCPSCGAYMGDENDAIS